METKNYPENLYVYYQNNKNLFEEKSNTTKKAVYYGLAIAFLVLFIKPDLVTESTFLLRIAAVIGIIICGFMGYFGGEYYVNIKSGGKISKIRIKKFDSSQVDEQTLINLLNSGNFSVLAQLPELDNQPLQLYIHEDKKGKTFYIQLMKYFSPSDFRGISDVYVIEGDDYLTHYSNITSI